MRSKKTLFGLLLIFGILRTYSQTNCDSILPNCDSIAIDSLWFVDDINFGDKLFVAFTTQHAFHYAPSYDICLEDESILFEDMSYEFFSMIGPTSFQVHYNFGALDVTGSAVLNVRIVNDNANNEFPSCKISFRR